MMAVRLFCYDWHLDELATCLESTHRRQDTPTLKGPALIARALPNQISLLFYLPAMASRTMVTYASAPSGLRCVPSAQKYSSCPVL